MSLNNLVRVGNRWINPWYVIEVEDACSRVLPPAPDQDCLTLVVLPGRSFTIHGDDATKLRRLLGGHEAESEPQVGGESDPDPPPRRSILRDHPEIISGHGPRPLIQPASVPEIG